MCLALAFPASAREKNKAEAPAPAPPLFKVSDEDSTLYLFATIGAPASDKSWRTRAISRAIDKSETMWFEAPVDDPAAMETANRIFAERAPAPAGAHLTDGLDETSLGALENAAAAAELTMAALSPLRPWAAFVLLSGRVHAGAAGAPVEAAIRAEADSRGRPVRFLFSIEESLALLTDMPAETERRLLIAAARDFSRQRADAPADFAAWRAGDLAAVDASLNAPLRQGAPGAFDLLVVKRNREIAARLAAILSEPGTAFVTLNAGYLAGEASLLDDLSALGLMIERIDEAAGAGGNLP